MIVLFSTLLVSSIPLTVADAAVPCRIQFDSPTYQVNENAGSVKLNVTLSQVISKDACVAYKTINGSAKYGIDYGPIAVFYGVIPAGKINTTIEIPIIDNNIWNPERSFQVEIIGACYATVSPPGLATVTILDNEATPTVQFNQTDYTVDEDAGTVTLNVTLSGKASDPVTVNYVMVDGTATSGEDYSPGSGSITIPAGESAGTFTANVMNDGKYSSTDEYFTARIASVTGPATVGTPAEAKVTLNEAFQLPTIRFEQASYTVSEGVGMFSFNVVLSHAFDHDVFVKCGAWDGTAKGDWDPELGDYLLDTTPHDYNIRIPAGSLMGTDSIPIVDDQLYEGDEYFNIGIGEAYYKILRENQRSGVVQYH